MKTVSVVGQKVGVRKAAAYVHFVATWVLGFVGWIVLIVGATLAGLVGRLVEILYKHLKPLLKLKK
ncbi:MAG: hypothetical protein O7J95_20655 [Planctomycetota bacterium]|nr:hypothetical protein [Planctomycetota bacterium]